MFKDYIGRLNDKIFLKDDEGIFADMQGAGIQIRTLLKVAKVYAKRVSEVKREKGIIDFNDMEHLALSILVKKEDGKLVYTETADKLANRFEEILIDEYQDSNQLQEVILNAVSKTRLTGENNNIYMVGDVKQSIYRFRMARPELFMEKYNTYTSDDSAHQRIDLHKNFRSRNEVLDFTNDIFYKIMAADLGNVQYDDDAALYPGASYPKETMRPELLLVDYKDEDLSEIIEDEDGDKVKIEALLIANRIRSLMENGMVTDKKTGQLRAVQYRDIVILSRSVATWGNTVAAVLKDCDIPAHVESNTGYFSSYEIQVILSMLRILDNPLQDIPMAAVRRSWAWMMRSWHRLGLPLRA